MRIVDNILNMNPKEIVDGLIARQLVPKIVRGKKSRNLLFDSVKTLFTFSLRESMECILALGQKYNQKYTFFVMGRLAEKNPTMLKHIVQYGHEIASHSYAHYLSMRLSPDDLLQELVDAKKIIEDIVGVPVRGYRAPHLLFHDCQYELLSMAGYRYSSSKYIHTCQIRYEFNRLDIQEIPVHFQDWLYVTEGMTVVLDNFADAMAKNRLLLLHPYIFGDRKTRYLWDAALKAAQPASKTISTLIDSKRLSLEPAITIDVGMGMW